jgi:hypothetical protein
MTSANDLIRGAYRKIGRASDDRNISQTKIKEGLHYLNLIFKSYLTNQFLIEYDETITFNLVVGQRDYVISKEAGSDVNENMIVSLKHVNLIKNNIRYPVEIVTDVYDFKTQRDISLSQRPKWVYLQNGINKSTLHFIVKPDLVYECVVKAKFGRNNILLTEINNDLREIPEGNYLFFEYQLAKIFHHNYPGSIWNAELEKTYQELKEEVEAASDIDVEIETSKALRFYGDKFTPTLGVIT